MIGVVHVGARLKLNRVWLITDAMTISADLWIGSHRDEERVH